MEKEELAKWMKAHGVDEQLRVWVQNDIAGQSDYSILEGLTTDGFVQIKITLLPSGGLSFEKVTTPYTPQPEILTSTLSQEPEPLPHAGSSLPSAEEETPKPRSRRRTE
jgi:hypothetical protein